MDADQQNIIVAPPYIRGVTERVTKILKPYDVKVFSKISNKLRYKVCKLKDLRKPQDKKNDVYKIKCNDCDAVYIGETGRTAKQRMEVHQTAVEKREERSHIYKHYRDTQGHRFNFNDVQILATEKLMMPRRFLEGIYTKFNEKAINRSINVPAYYYGIIGTD